jgi:hypothetical protein
MSRMLLCKILLILLLLYVMEKMPVWSHHLKANGKEATLESLLTWMNREMKSRMMATAPVRNQSTSVPIGHMTGSQSGTRCLFCSNQSHWTDQCLKFTALSPEDRMKAVKENHACFSCLKRAARDHRVSNYSRR